MSRTGVGSFLFVGDRPVHVRVDGPDEGPPIVLVHGFSCSLHWYDDLVAELSAEFRLIRLDLHGHGCTDGQSGLGARVEVVAGAGHSVQVERPIELGRLIRDIVTG